MIQHLNIFRRPVKMSQSNPQFTLENFNRLPDSARVRLPVVAALYGCSPATVWRRVKQNIIPAPRKTKNITSWSVGELRRDLENK
jgi:predicted DNA-binding transcriptional regulator AlpA